jgi:hypothetical protein
MQKRKKQRVCLMYRDIIGCNKIMNLAEKNKQELKKKKINSSKEFDQKIS